MNKRIKKKCLLAELQRANNLQQEVIEYYGNQLAQVKREMAELRAIVEQNAEAANNRFDLLNKAVEQWLEQSKQEIEEIRLRANLAEADLLERLEGLLQVVYLQNVEATNARFDVLEAENKSMRVDLDEAVIEFRKNKKKGLFGRK
ncbi:hypothetical protein Javan173_0019 [Streptococcus phage Javan173]|uniref:hypothetical protein n=1 Tax=Streptococcus entericus TaxID=155680 RepID=UPI00035F428B|nr:hypothetical protein [Streptococcus entericus]QBX15148.1 hypothetical protein Javan173_0019 [Streptococcus phage Javan173]